MEIDRVVLVSVDEAKSPVEYLFISSNDAEKYLVTEERIKCLSSFGPWESGSFKVLKNEDEGMFLIEKLPEPERSTCKIRIEPA